MLVIDASIALAWCFADETTPETEALLDRVVDHGAYVPALWKLEISNVLLLAERRGRLVVGQVDDRLLRLDRLPIMIDHEASGSAQRHVLAIARDEKLTAYDAACLELALRKGLPIATLDKELAAAALRRNVMPVL